MSKADVMDIDAPIDDDDDDQDPIIASYNVYLNPALPLARRLLVLEQPNRTDDAPRASPTELRIKSQTGMVEVDIPLDNTTAYDRDKGLRWGRSLQASMAAKNGGSHGLAGGFGFGAVQQQRARKQDDDEYLDWNEAVRQDKVLRVQTLGGQYPDTDEAQFMVGVFQGKNIHFTPVSSLIPLRAQLHHLDAAAQQERSVPVSKDLTNGTSAAPTVARAIHMTVKNTEDGDAVAVETMADRLRWVQTEPWRSMRYVNENDQAAWDVYNESLFLHAPGADPKQSNAGAEHLEDLVPRFAATWGDGDMLQAVSDVDKPDEEEMPPVELERGPEETSQPRDKSKGAAAPKRTTRAKGPATTVDID